MGQGGRNEQHLGGVQTMCVGECVWYDVHHAVAFLSLVHLNVHLNPQSISTHTCVSGGK